MSNLEEKESLSSTFEVDIIKYASIRRNEIDLLHNESFLGKEVKHKSLFQLLPRHMRRRTMGYIRKRLPHRIRKAAIIKPPSKVNKRPSRKYRRRPSNLLNEYERRKRAHDGKMWLETHIWHAKRFHMSESTYGYRLPLFDNVKCKRAVYKCLNKYACVHDESYHVCHELSGRFEDLLEGLSKLCSPQTGLTFAAKICLNGQYEGRTVLYESNKYPYNCIGPVRFLWKTEIEQSSSKTIWIWSHPSIHKQVESELINVFNMSLKVDESKDVEMESANGDQQPQVKKRKLENETENINEPINSQIYVSQDEKNTSLKCLKDSLIRFKLLGPLSTTILANVLKPVESTEYVFDLKCRA
jgi:ribonuclease P/MRP protein subunit POP1